MKVFQVFMVHVDTHCNLHSIYSGCLLHECAVHGQKFLRSHSTSDKFVGAGKNWVKMAESVLSSIGYGRESEICQTSLFFLLIC